MGKEEGKETQSRKRRGTDTYSTHANKFVIGKMNEFGQVSGVRSLHNSEVSNARRYITEDICVQVISFVPSLTPHIGHCILLNTIK